MKKTNKNIIKKKDDKEVENIDKKLEMNDNEIKKITKKQNKNQIENNDNFSEFKKQYNDEISFIRKSLQLSNELLYKSIKITGKIASTTVKYGTKIGSVVEPLKNEMKEDFSIDKASLISNTLSYINPLVGYVAGSAYNAYSDKIKEGFGNVSEKIKDMFSKKSKNDDIDDLLNDSVDDTIDNINDNIEENKKRSIQKKKELNNKIKKIKNNIKDNDKNISNAFDDYETEIDKKLKSNNISNKTQSEKTTDIFDNNEKSKKLTFKQIYEENNNNNNILENISNKTNDVISTVSKNNEYIINKVDDIITKINDNNETVANKIDNVVSKINDNNETVADKIDNVVSKLTDSNNEILNNVTKKLTDNNENTTNKIIEANKTNTGKIIQNNNETKEELIKTKEEIIDDNINTYEEDKESSELNKKLQKLSAEESDLNKKILKKTLIYTDKKVKKLLELQNKKNDILSNNNINPPILRNYSFDNFIKNNTNDIVDTSQTSQQILSEPTRLKNYSFDNFAKSQTDIIKDQHMIDNNRYIPLLKTTAIQNEIDRSKNIHDVILNDIKEDAIYKLRTMFEETLIYIEAQKSSINQTLKQNSLFDINKKMLDHLRMIRYSLTGEEEGGFFRRTLQQVKDSYETFIEHNRALFAAISLFKNTFKIAFGVLTAPFRLIFSSKKTKYEKEIKLTKNPFQNLMNIGIAQYSALRSILDLQNEEHKLKYGEKRKINIESQSIYRKSINFLDKKFREKIGLTNKGLEKGILGIKKIIGINNKNLDKPTKDFIKKISSPFNKFRNLVLNKTIRKEKIQQRNELQKQRQIQSDIYRLGLQKYFGLNLENLKNILQETNSQCCDNQYCGDKSFNLQPTLLKPANDLVNNNKIKQIREQYHLKVVNGPDVYYSDEKSSKKNKNTKTSNIIPHPILKKEENKSQEEGNKTLKEIKNILEQTSIDNKRNQRTSKRFFDKILLFGGLLLTTIKNIIGKVTGIGSLLNKFGLLKVAYDLTKKWLPTKNKLPKIPKIPGTDKIPSVGGKILQKAIQFGSKTLPFASKFGSKALPFVGKLAGSLLTPILGGYGIYKGMKTDLNEYEKNKFENDKKDYLNYIDPIFAGKMVTLAIRARKESKEAEKKAKQSQKESYKKQIEKIKTLLSKEDWEKYKKQIEKQENPLWFTNKLKREGLIHYTNEKTKFKKTNFENIKKELKDKYDNVKTKIKEKLIPETKTISKEPTSLINNNVLEKEKINDAKKERKEKIRGQILARLGGPRKKDIIKNEKQIIEKTNELNIDIMKNEEIKKRVIKTIQSKLYEKDWNIYKDEIIKQKNPMLFIMNLKRQGLISFKNDINKNNNINSNSMLYKIKQPFIERDESLNRFQKAREKSIEKAKNLLTDSDWKKYQFEIMKQEYPLSFVNKLRKENLVKFKKDVKNQSPSIFQKIKNFFIPERKDNKIHQKDQKISDNNGNLIDEIKNDIIGYTQKLTQNDLIKKGLDKLNNTLNNLTNEIKKSEDKKYDYINNINNVINSSIHQNSLNNMSNKYGNETVSNFGQKNEYIDDLIKGYI